jgi:hypothetical protein
MPHWMHSSNVHAIFLCHISNFGPALHNDPASGRYKELQGAHQRQDWILVSWSCPPLHLTFHVLAIVCPCPSDQHTLCKGQLQSNMCVRTVSYIYCSNASCCQIQSTCGTTCPARRGVQAQTSSTLTTNTWFMLLVRGLLGDWKEHVWVLWAANLTATCGVVNCGVLNWTKHSVASHCGHG